MKRKVKLQFNFSNRFLYTFIALMVVIVGLLGVYAYTGNVGHTSSQIDEADPSIPKNCLNNQILQWSGSAWTCADMAVSSGSKWLDSVTAGDIYYNDGNVGIGTTSPSSALHVEDSVSVTGPTYDESDSILTLKNTNPNNEGFMLMKAGGGGNYIISQGVDGSSQPLQFVTGSVPKMRIMTDGKVGIGTTSPTETLDVAGNIKLSGTILGGAVQGGLYGWCQQPSCSALAPSYCNGVWCACSVGYGLKKLGEDSVVTYYSCYKN